MGHFQIFNLIVMSYIIGDSYSTAYASSERSKHDNNMLWCRACGVHVADITNSVNTVSPGAIKIETRNILGRNITVQKLVNPYKSIFEILTTHTASCEDVGQNRRADSWFPGYTWRVCTCPHCSNQLGWTFEKILTNDLEDNNDKAPFHGLMLSALLAITNDSNIAELTTPLPKSTNLSSTSQPAIIPRASEDVLKPSTTVSQDDTIEIPLKYSKRTVAPGKIVVLRKGSRNVTGSKSSTGTRTQSPSATPRDLLY